LNEPHTDILEHFLLFFINGYRWGDSKG